MAKLTKQQRKAHAEAEAILTKDRLTEDEKDFVFQNWHEGANHINGEAGAFFTPWDLAGDFAVDVGNGRIIDLCAGIGVLSYFVHARSRWGTVAEITCIERNPRYVEVGRKLLPEARWINADVFAWREWWRDELGGVMFDHAIGNPPFGTVKRAGTGPRFRGREFEFHVIDIAAEMANYGTFIIPAQSATFRLSGAPYYDRRETGRGIDFEKATGWNMAAGAGIDTAMYRNDWKDTNMLCEVACFDFAEDRQRKQQKLPSAPFPPAKATVSAQQLALF